MLNFGQNSKNKKVEIVGERIGFLTAMAIFILMGYFIASKTRSISFDRRVYFLMLLGASVIYLASLKLKRKKKK